MSATFLPTKTHRHPHKLAAAVLAALAITMGAASVYALAQPGVDHDGCQNPATHSELMCDNSDPACPEAIKGGSCMVAPTVALPTSHNISSTDFVPSKAGK